MMEFPSAKAMPSLKSPVTGAPPAPGATVVAADVAGDEGAAAGESGDVELSGAGAGVAVEDGYGGHGRRGSGDDVGMIVGGVVGDAALIVVAGAGGEWRFTRANEAVAAEG